MRKKIIFTLLLCVSLKAQEYKIDTGVLSYMSTSIYKGKSHDLFLVPLLSAEYKNFYISGTEAGYTFFTNETLSVSLETSPTLIGYQSDESAFLKGMGDRDLTLETGLKLEYTYDIHKFKVKAVYDFFNVYDSYSALLEYAHLYPIEEKHLLINNYGVEYFSSKKSTYYFGVLPSESTSQREQYALDESYTIYTSVDYIYALRDQWTLFLNLEYKLFDSQIFKSPIVDKRSAVSSFIGVVYAW
ncbi:MAG: MipA/OmpV family protein [Helicobacteraceae bacterium]|nr:MipA/OmpV family protein [Helicobacteraceae bacterium]